VRGALAAASKEEDEAAGWVTLAPLLVADGEDEEAVESFCSSTQDCILLESMLDL
jgi:hypothetical protein